jgi:hypothetical protein
MVAEIIWETVADLRRGWLCFAKVDIAAEQRVVAKHGRDVEHSWPLNLRAPRNLVNGAGVHGWIESVAAASPAMNGGPKGKGP